MRIQSFFNASLLSIFSLLFLLAGCANVPTAVVGGKPAGSFQGAVHGGQQPVANATIQLYTVGTSADGSFSTPLLSQVVKSDSNGSFSITSLYSCDNATLVYLVATGGDPGIGTVNSNLSLMAALGPCSSLTPSTFISVNEVTTVAAVAALAPFMASGSAIGSSVAHQAALVAAFGVASQLANPTTGTSPGTNVPAGFTVPSTLINSLANIAAACINTSGGTSSTPTICGQFFLLTTPGTAVSPTNVISALLNLANNPTLNTAALFDLITPSAPFQPTLAAAPADFRVRPLSQSPAAISVSPVSIVFPAGTVNVPSAPQSVQVQNVSTATVSNLALAFSGANATNFSQTNGCPGTLNPGDICTVQVKLTPSAAGPRIGYLNVTADGVPTQYVAMTNVNATPVLSSLSPPTVPAGSPNGLYVYAIGSNFTPASALQINGARRAFGYVSSNYLVFLLTSADQASPGSLTVSVTNPGPGGGTSSNAIFTVSAAVGTPVISSVSPSQFVAGAASTTIQVNGTNLSPNCIVQWNGANLSTSFGYAQGGYYLQATVPLALLANSGSASVTVSNPTVTPSISNSLAVTIAPPPPPTLTGLSTTFVPTNTALNLTVSGSNFTTTTSVLINGVVVPATFVSAYQMNVALPSSQFVTPGVYSVVVSNGQGTTSAQNITAYVQLINNSMVYSPLTGLFYLSVPSAAGSPYGNSIVSVDPLTGVLGTPIPVGSEPNRMAITSDGRYVWVALDAALAVRKVDLVAGTAGLQFPIAPSAATVVSALAAIPGSTDSVVVSTYFTGYTTPTGTSLMLYDAGVPRPKSITFGTYNPFPYALIVDGTKNEIYGPGEVLNQGPYNTYTYDATGITLKASTPNALPQMMNLNDDIRIDAGKLYTSMGKVVDAETAAPIGTFYSSGTTPASGSITLDTALGKTFILEGSNNYSVSATYTASPVILAAFHSDDFTAIPSATLSLSMPNYRPDSQIQGPTGARLTRWGTTGLAFRGPGGFVSFRTPLVQDISANVADLSVALSASGSATTGSTTTYTATVTNNGPSPASNVLLSAVLPASGSLTSATASQGTCMGISPVLCNLGPLANGTSTTVTFKVLQTNSGSAVMTAQVSASESDTAPLNNQASSTLTITGNSYSLVPAVASLSPAAVLSGSSDTVITVNGSNFTNLSSVLLNGIPILSSFTSSSVLTAVVPAANLATLGWSSVAVSTPAPGGGTSPALPLTVFSVLNIGANHILSDPYSRNVMASIGVGSASVQPNSIATITPESAAVSSVVPLSAAPAEIALSSNGEALYALIPGTTSGSIARYNMLTQQAEFTASGLQATGYNVGLRDIAVQPGSPNTIAVDQGEYPGVALYDADPAAKTLTKRGSDTGLYTGTCLAFRDSSSLLLTDLYSGGGLVWSYQVTQSGLTNLHTGSTLNYFSCFKLDGTTLYSQGGGVADTSGTSIVQKGVFPGLPNLGYYGTGIKHFALDSSLGKAFYLTSSKSGNYSAAFDGLTTYDTQTFMPTSILPLPIAAIEGTSYNTGVDAVRWGQDGLAFVTSSGRVYLMRGPALVPQLLQSASAALPSSALPLSVAHGTGNLTLTLTGSNLLPGVAVQWNGSYRTTRLVDATHVQVFIPAADLAAVGTASITAINPGAPVSSAINFSIQ